MTELGDSASPAPKDVAPGALTEGTRVPLRAWLIEIFAAGNLAFLAIDVYVAHLVNDFAHKAEWIPVVFSCLAPLALFPGIFTKRLSAGLARYLGLFVGGAALLVGLLGFLFHMESTFFRVQSIMNLVYTAPFSAPLAYAGIGLLIILNRIEPHEGRDWGRWVVLLALAGCVGNLALALADHAQNGFFHATEWIPVVSAALAIGFLIPACFEIVPRYFLRLCLGVMGLQIVVAVLGFVLHLLADVEPGGAMSVDNFVHGAPIFAPLLFADLAVPAVIGIWHLLVTENSAESAQGAAPQKGKQ